MCFLPDRRPDFPRGFKLFSITTKPARARRRDVTGHLRSVGSHNDLKVNMAARICFDLVQTDPRSTIRLSDSEKGVPTEAYDLRSGTTPLRKGPPRRRERRKDIVHTK